MSGFPASEGAGVVSSFERTLETATAIIHFHSEHEDLAQRVAEVVDYAHAAVGESFGQMAGRVNTYIYGSDSEMAEGLRQVLGYKPWEVNAILRVGISACTHGTLHIHERAARWGDFLWHALVDEYVHGVIEERFGTRPARSATWLEEGVTAFVAQQALTERLSTFEQRFLVRRYKRALQALISGKLPRFADVSTRERWYRNISRSRATWHNQYAMAYLGVLYIVERYGFGAVERILTELKQGVAYPTAMRQVLGLSLEGFEFRFRHWLVLRGVFNVYLKYTAVALILFALGMLLVAYC